MKNKSVALIKAAATAHDAEWATKRDELRNFKNLYAQRFWENGEAPGDVTVETGDGASHIESYIAALFSRAPAVEMKLEMGTDQVPALPIQKFVNPWLAKARPVFERATRLAIMYPAGFLRVGPSPGLGRKGASLVEVRSVPPWDVILDRAAPDWEHQRFVGHRYTVPLAEALRKFPSSVEKRWAPCVEEEYFESTMADPRVNEEELPDELRLVSIVEFYDMVRNKLLFWSKDYDSGDDVLADTPIPLRMPGTEIPCHPLVPLYFSYEPDKPLSGISTLARTYDQLREKNLLRTNTASGVRRDVRTWLARAGVFSEEELAKLRRGEDGTILVVREGEKRPLSDLLFPVPYAPLSGNFDRYMASIESDLDKGSVLAAFTRGEASRATATEIGVLAEYSSSAIGRMARERDAAIEEVARLFLAHVIVASDADTPIAAVAMDEGAMAIEKSDLDREWLITALDQAGTPVSRAVAQQRFMTLIPILQAMGVQPQAILQALVRFELLPPEFANMAMQPPAPPAAPGPEGKPEGEPGEQPLPGQPAGPGVDASLREALHVPDTAGAGPGASVGGMNG